MNAQTDTPEPSASPTPSGSLATRDARPFFERVLQFAIEHSRLDADRIAGLRREGSKALVQLASFFGTPNLRPELEAARVRLVTLVSLALERASNGSLDQATVLLQQKTLLALSKSGADALRSLLALPSETYLTPALPMAEMEKHALDEWTLEAPMTRARFEAEHDRREQIAALHDLCYWLAHRLGAGRSDIELSEPCEAVINSALLLLWVEPEPKRFFSPQAFMELHARAVRKRKQDFPALATWLANAPAALAQLLQRESGRFIDRVLPALKAHSAAEFMPHGEMGPVSGHFYFAQSAIDELTHHDETQAANWRKITAGKGDHPDVMCTILLRVAVGLQPLPMLRKKDAIETWNQFRQHGLDHKAVVDFIERIVPFQYQLDTRRLWEDDLGPDAELHLDDEDEEQVLAYLHDTCRVSYKQR